MVACWRVGGTECSSASWDLLKEVAIISITSTIVPSTTVETVSDFIFLSSKITADDDCSHEIKRCLLLGRKVRTNLGSVLKSRDITLPRKVRLVKAMVWSCVVMNGCESWTVKKAECQIGRASCRERV